MLVSLDMDGLPTGDTAGCCHLVGVGTAWLHWPGKTSENTVSLVGKSKWAGLTYIG